MAYIARARTFDSTDDYIQLAIGKLAAAIGPLSIAALIRPNDENEIRTLMGLIDPGGLAFLLTADASGVGAVQYFDLTSFGSSTSNAGVVTEAQDWQLVLATKATGTVAPRLHRYIYSTGVWLHENFVDTIADPTAPTTATEFFVGVTRPDLDEFFNGEIACMSFWNRRALSDAECERIPLALIQWYKLAPSGLWLFDQENVTDPVADLVGDSHEIARVGTTVTAVTDLPFELGTDGLPDLRSRVPMPMMEVPGEDRITKMHRRSAG